MTLLEYYKREIFEDGRHMQIRNPEEADRYTEGAYWQDEMDYYICADYYGMMGEFTKQDEALLEVLGFTKEDFENEDE